MLSREFLRLICHECSNYFVAANNKKCQGPPEIYDYMYFIYNHVKGLGLYFHFAFGDRPTSGCCAELEILKS